MIEQLKTFDDNRLAFMVIDSFTETDVKFAQKIFQEKLDQGFEPIHILIQLDELKISHIQTKAFFEDTIFVLRNFQNLGHLAIVAHSNIIKALVPIDNLFFQRASKGRLEKYFDVSQIEEAYAFIKS